MKPSLSESLRTETRVLHTQAERSTFMGVLLRGKMERPAYCAMLRNLHAIYAALEPALDRHVADPLLSPLSFAQLRREGPLQADLDTLHGADWRDAIAIQPTTVDYVARLRKLDEEEPALLAAHSYVRYLGDLSGGQMLRRIVRDSMALPPGEGTAFYEFGTPEETVQLKKAYREGLEQLQVDEATIAALVAEARLAFELHKQLFEELTTDVLPTSSA
ncbi:heme oxygenase (biliverdin-producing) [soil metagenome]